MLLASAIDGPADAPVVMLVGSLGTTSDIWRPQVGDLADTYRVVRLDLRGHGRSPAPPGPYTVPELARDALETMDALGIDHASWVGLSIGGMLGQWLAANKPHRIDRLIVLFSAAAVPEPEQFRRRAAEVLRRGGAGHLASELLERWLTPAYRVQHPETSEWLAEMLASISPAGYAGCAEALASVDLRRDLRRIVAPTLVVGGAQDGSLPPRCAAAVAEGIASAHHVELDPAGHLGTIERSDVLNPMLIEFLRP